jgi:lysozyme family protein
MNFDEAFDRLIESEGGYVSNPKDPGGETRFGVTIAVARANGYQGPMKDLPLEFSKNLYRGKYWAPIKAEQLPQALRFEVFDAAVNSGVGQAVKWLQRAVGTAEDGIIGPATIAASNAAGPHLAANYDGIRLEFMTDLKNWPTFSRGWAKRIASNLKALGK